MQPDPAIRVLEALEREGVRYAVFGAVAINIHGLARSTEDLDIFIAPERQNVEALKLALRSVFSDPEIDQITADDLLGDYPPFEGLVVTVATPRTLYRMKKDTVRVKDRVDADALRLKFNLEVD